MNQHPLLLVLLTGIIACQQGKKANVVTTADSNLIKQADSTGIALVQDTTYIKADSVIKADTISYQPEQLVGKWLRPVPGLDREMQGFDLKKDGIARSINMYSLVYEKWQLIKDTLLLWNHTEGVLEKDSAATVDTTVIRALTDTTLVLFPVKAAEGYLEKYEKEKKKSQKAKIKNKK